MLIKETDLAGIETVIAFASYMEAENLAVILSGLSEGLDERHLIVIADDSGTSYRKSLEEACSESLKHSRAKLSFSYADTKTGRGAAIRRVFAEVFELGQQIQFFIESDSDGSHRPEDILKILNHASGANLVIGSRYSPGSKITGWPLTRRVFSKLLNLSIPKILKVPSKDLTNGLRRYDRAATHTLLMETPMNTGFIYLSEVAFLVSRAGLVIEDTPIHFENRLHGSSTVGTAEISNSLLGLWGLLSLRSKENARF